MLLPKKCAQLILWLVHTCIITDWFGNIINGSDKSNSTVDNSAATLQSDVWLTLCALFIFSFDHSCLCL